MMGKLSTWRDTSERTWFQKTPVRLHGVMPQGIYRARPDKRRILAGPAWSFRYLRHCLRKSFACEGGEWERRSLALIGAGQKCLCINPRPYYCFFGFFFAFFFKQSLSSLTIAQTVGFSYSLQFAWLYNGHSGYCFDTRLPLFQQYEAPQADWKRDWGVCGTGYRLLLTLSLRTGEHLKTMTLLDPSMRSSPVAGFLPLLSFFCLTQNFPKPLIITFSSFSNFPFMISKRLSTTSVDFFLERSCRWWIDSFKSAFVKVIKYAPHEKKTVRKGFLQNLYILSCKQFFVKELRRL